MLGRGCYWNPDEIRMWCTHAVVVGLCVAASWSLYGFSVTLFYTTPMWLTLFVLGPWPQMQPWRCPCIVPCVSLLLFIASISWVKTFPGKCRELWETKLLYDAAWTPEAMMAALRAHRKSLLPGVGRQELEEWLAVHADSLGNLDVGSAPAVALPHPLAGAGGRGPAWPPAPARRRPLGEAAPEEVEREEEFPQREPERRLREFAPMASDVAVAGSSLRMYCLAHSGDNPRTFPKTFVFYKPPNSLRPYLDRFHHRTCLPWTCTFTEKSRSDAWAYIGVLVLAMIATSFHCLTNSHMLATWFGAGTVRYWWFWFWATFLPMWSTIYLTKAASFSVAGYYGAMLNLFFTILSRLETVVVLVLMAFAALFAARNRERIARFLGIEDHDFLRWENLSRAHRVRSRRAIQVCVWRLDVDSARSRAELGRWEATRLEKLAASGGAGTDRAEDDPSTRKPPGLSSNLFTSASAAFMRIAGASDSADEDEMGASGRARRKLNFPGGMPPSAFVRVAWGDNELQNSRVHRPLEHAADIHMIYIQENFRVLAGGIDSARLYIEVRDQGFVGSHELSRVVLTEEQVLDECDRAQALVSKLRRAGQWRDDARGGASLATEQIMRMLEPASFASCNTEVADAQRLRLYLAGFKPHELSDGGAIWLAFADLSADEHSTMLGLGRGGQCALM